MGPRDLGWLLALLAVTAVWGWTFVVVKDAVSVVPVLLFLAVRFWLGGLTMGAAWLATRPQIPRGSVRPLLQGGALAGSALAAGYLLQTLGLRTTSAASAGLLTGLFVVLTPLGEWAWRRRRPGLTTLLCAGICFTGMGILAAPTPQAARLGDLLVTGCAAAFALHILVLAGYSPRVPPVPLTAVQMLVAALWFTGLAANELSRLTLAGRATGALLLTGVAASGLAFLVMTAAQRRLSAARTAMVLAAEPAFAVAFAFWLAGERYGPVQWAGALLILGGLAWHEWRQAPGPAG
ncbi:MAG: DMT family transporter [Candidatus Dormibacteria bacterium]